MSITSQVIFMQDFNQESNKQRKISPEELSFDERQRLVETFAWLVEQDKKQNPEFYQLNNKKDD